MKTLTQKYIIDLKIIEHLQDTMEVCEFLIEKLGYTPEGSSVNELIEESKQIIQQLKE